MKLSASSPRPPEPRPLTATGRFTAAAATYDRRTPVQQAAAHRLAAWLPAAAKVRRILEVGCGTGRLTRILRERFPGAQLDALDISGGMVAHARRALADAGGIAWHVGDAARFRPERRYDLIAGNCSLHWMHPLEAGLRNLAGLRAPGGQLVFSAMLNGTLRELHEARRHAAPGHPPLDRLPEDHVIRAALAAADCPLEDPVLETAVEWLPSAAECLRRLHLAGLTGGRFSHSDRLLTRGELARLTEFYQQRFGRADGCVPANYVIGYFRSIPQHSPHTTD